MVELHILDAQGTLANYKKKIKELFRSSYKKISEVLVVNALDVTVEEEPKHVIPGMVIGGYAPGPHRVEIYMDTSKVNFARLFTAQFPVTLAHELHHAVRWKTVGYGTTLGEALVTEGLAMHFEAEVFPEDLSPWAKALDEKQDKGLWPRVQKELTKKGYDHNAWFFGSHRKNIPHWAGYRIGYRLVGQYLSETGKLASECVGVTAAKVLNQVGVE